LNIQYSPDSNYKNQFLHLCQKASQITATPIEVQSEKLKAMRSLLNMLCAHEPMLLSLS
jgi:hypothetical protein